MTLLSIGIQHHPHFRQEIVAQLVAELEQQAAARGVGASPVTVEVVNDPDPNGTISPWRCYREALARTPEYATHRLILQDDVTPCRHFVEAATRAIAARPGRIIVFHVSGNPHEHAVRVWTASSVDLPWTDLDHDRWCPVVATCYPAGIVADIVAFGETQQWTERFTADDEVIGRFCRTRNIYPAATVPSLVEHEDLVPSVMSARAGHGTDPGRRAACFIHPGCDPLTIDWNDPRAAG